MRTLNQVLETIEKTETKIKECEENVIRWTGDKLIGKGCITEEKKYIKMLKEMVSDWKQDVLDNNPRVYRD